MKVVLVLLVSVFSMAGATDFNTDGVSSQTPCENGAVCLRVDGRDTATCVDGECQCRNTTFRIQRRDGQLDCYRNRTRWGIGTNDPLFKTFDLEPQHVYDMPLPCRSLFGHTTSTLRARNENPKVVGSCECKFYSWNKRVDGKIFIEGIDMTCIMDRTEPTAFYHEFSTRIFGYANNGSYTFYESGNYTFDAEEFDDTIRVEIDEPNIYYQSEYDFDNNRVVLDNHACGVRAVLTPYDKVLKTAQPFLPGFSYALNCVHEHEYLSRDIVMGTGPADFGGPDTTAVQVAGLSLSTSFWFRYLRSLTPQTQPDPNNQCTMGATIVDKCDTVAELEMVEERCRFIFFKSHFIDCVETTNNGYNIMELYLDCVNHICDDALTCAPFVANLMAKAAGCPAKATDCDAYQQHVNGTWTC